MTIIPTCFFKQYRQGKCLLPYFTTKKTLVETIKCLLRYSRTKKAFLGFKNKMFKTPKSWHFSKGDKPWFWSKNGHFSKVFFLGNIGQKNVFYDILQPKNSFLGYKNKKFKKSKNWNFLTPMVLVPKWPLFETLFFRQYSQGKCRSCYSRT